MFCLATKRSCVFRARLCPRIFILKYDRRKILIEKYKEMYLILFNAITEATKILEVAQKKAEEIFMED